MQNNHSPSPTGQNYLDFELEIGPGSAREYPVAVIRSPAGEARETLHFPFDELALDNRLKDLQIALLRSGGKRRQLLSPEERTVQEFGRALFDSLLVGEVRSRYDVSQREAEQQGKGLRFKLRIQSPELAALPWEFLYDSRQAEYICLSRNTPVVRYLELPQPIPPLTVAPPPRILGMIASPSDLPPLDVTREKQRVEQATQALRQNGLIELTWLEGQTWRDLQRAMRSGPWHMFHFIGHGGFDRQTDEGLIAISNEEGQARNLTATQLGRLLADHRSLRLVLLNACEGARGSQRDIFSSAASILVRRGIPAVLAMQYEVTDRASIELARAFYEALAENMPIDAATSEARKAVSLEINNTVEWGTPVLYMRSPDGVLFSLQASDKQQDEAENLARAQAAQRQAHLAAEKAQAVRKAKEAERLERESAQAAQRQTAGQIAKLSSQLAKAESGSDWARVIELGKRILKLDATHQPTRAKTATAYRNRRVNYHNNVFYGRTSGDYDPAIADLNRAIELDPNQADYYRQRGVSYRQKGDYDRAIADYNRAIELDPKNARYLQQRGVSYHMKGDYDRAIADKTRAVELDPNQASYYYSRGLPYKLKGDRAAARRDFEHAAEMGHADAKKELAKL